MNPLLQNTAQQKELEQNGLVRGPGLSMELVETIKAEFARQEKQYQKDNLFQSTNMLLDERQRMQDFAFLSNTLKPYLDEVFQDYKIVMPNFLFKPTEPSGGGIDLHQDWSYVDEDQFYSLNLWIPLVDTSADNGTMHGVRGSHRLGKTIRGRNIWWPFYDLKDEIVRNLCEPLDMKAGESVIHYNSLLHYTSPNVSGADRLAISVIVTFKQADVMVYFDKDGHIYKAKGGDDFYLRYGVFDPHFDEHLHPQFVITTAEYKKQVEGLVNTLTKDAVPTKR